MIRAILRGFFFLPKIAENLVSGISDAIIEPEVFLEIGCQGFDCPNLVNQYALVLLHLEEI